MKEELILAIPSKGRFMEESCALLQEAGLDFTLRERALSVPASYQGRDLTLAMMRPKDIAKLVASEKLPLGIVGSDTLAGYKPWEVQRLLSLGMGRCDLVLAAPKDSRYKTEEEANTGNWEFLTQFAGTKIATSYRGIVEDYLDSAELRRERYDDPVPRSYLDLDGAVEVAPSLGLADVVADLVETGRSMEANGLKVLGTVFTSEGTLVTTGSNEKGDIPLLDDIRDSLFEIMLRRENPDAVERQQRYEALQREVALFR